MQDSLTSEPFILSIHHDHMDAMRELRAEDMERVGGGQDCPKIGTVIFYPDGNYEDDEECL